MEPQQIFHAPVWGDPQAMTEALRRIKRDIGGTAEDKPHADVLQASLNRFASTKRAGNFTELKYVCYGVTVPVGKEQWRIIDRRPLFDKLIQEVAKYEHQPKQFRRCYQGLLSGYFGFDRYGENATHGLPTWERLRGYLDEKLAPVLRVSNRRGTTPDWLRILKEHRNLLTDDPCSRYATGLSRDDPSDLKEACTGLGIEVSSWVWQDALMAYVRLVCQRKDAAFNEGLPGILKVVNGTYDLKLPATLATQAVAMTVIRYAQCTDRPEHTGLRDTCLQWIGNPWLRRTSWDAHVNDESARQMVNSWLKRRLIRDFFELLAEDGAADVARLNYWLNWEPQITDMWFVLGVDARGNRSKAFVELRKRMEGRDRVLTDSPSDNNAFVMRIGPLLVIEFGVTGNACYVFAASDFKADLDNMYLSLHVLKQKISATRLSHMSRWESRFDYELNELLRSVPISKSNLRTKESQANSSPQQKHAGNAFSALKPSTKSPNDSQQKATTTAAVQATSVWRGRRAFTDADFQHLQIKCAQYSIDWEDNRPKQGALWVLLDDRKRRPGFATLLEQYGFRYTAGKGFWLKGEE